MRSSRRVRSIDSGADFMVPEGLEPPQYLSHGLMQYISALNN